MGLFEKIFRHPSRAQIEKSFDTFTAYSPCFTTWRGGVYEQELVRAAIHAKASHISKLGVDIEGSGKPRLRSDLQKGPNAYMTWSQFLYRVSTILDVQNTAFIVPVFNEYGDVTGIFPILPSTASLVQSDGTPYIRYTFRSGKTAAVELDQCGIMTKHQYDDDFYGASNEALIPTMQLINIQNQGIEEGVKSSATYRFMATLKNFSRPEDLTKERKRFTAENLAKDGGGMLLFPNTYDNIQQIKTSPYTVDAEQMKLIQNNVMNYFGVNEKVMQNAAMGDDLDAFFNGAIEPFAIQLSDVLTKMLFTLRERGTGNRVIVNANRLQYMTTSSKISMATQLGDRGMIMIDEIRALFNYPPLPEGLGQKAPIRGEYYFDGEEENQNGNQE